MRPRVGDEMWCRCRGAHTIRDRDHQAEVAATRHSAASADPQQDALDGGRRNRRARGRSGHHGVVDLRRAAGRRRCTAEAHASCTARDGHRTSCVHSARSARAGLNAWLNQRANATRSSLGDRVDVPARSCVRGAGRRATAAAARATSTGMFSACPAGADGASACAACPSRCCPSRRRRKAGAVVGAVQECTARAVGGRMANVSRGMHRERVRREVAREPSRSRPRRARNPAGTGTGIALHASPQRSRRAVPQRDHRAASAMRRLLLRLGRAGTVYVQVG